MIEFFKLIEDGLDPTLAEKSAHGTLPTNAFRYCEAIRLASGFGWYVFLPMDLWLKFDGSEIHVSLDEGHNWFILSDAIQYPNFSDQFDANAPDDCKGYAPPFLTRTSTPGGLQIWTGLIARAQRQTAGWLRHPVNYNFSLDYEVLEGVIELDWWFGPLFTNIRIHKRDTPIILRANQPFLQLLPFSMPYQNEYANSGAPKITSGLENMSQTEWSSYADTIVHRVNTRQSLGDYGKEARKHAKQGRLEEAKVD